MKGKELGIQSLAIIGYNFLSLINNMGMVYWVMRIFIVFLVVKLVLYIYESKVETITPTSPLSHPITLSSTLSSSLHHHLSTHQPIITTSLFLYLKKEYLDTSCFELICLISDTKISSTRVVKGDVVVGIVVGGGLAV